MKTPSLNLPILGLTPSLGKRPSPPLCRWLSSAKFGIRTSSQLSSSRSLRKRKCPWPCLEMERVCIRMERSPGIWWVGWPGCKRSCNAMDCPTQWRIFALKISVVLPLKKYRTAWKIYTSEGRQTKLIPSTGQRGEASKIRSHQYLLRVSGGSAWRVIWLAKARVLCKPSLSPCSSPRDNLCTRKVRSQPCHRSCGSCSSISLLSCWSSASRTDILAWRASISFCGKWRDQIL